MPRWTLTAFLLLAACSSQGTLVVQVRTDLRPELEFDEVQVTLVGLDVDLAERVFTRAASETDEWTAVRLLEVPSLPPGTYRAVASLALDGAVLVTRPARVLITGDSLTVVTFLLTRDCRGVSCPGGDDPSLVACLAGRCVVEGCTDETPELCPMAQCDADRRCPAGPTCATPECTTSGTCFAVTNHALCAADEVCDATAGCLTVGPGGPPGTLDPGFGSGGVVRSGPPGVQSQFNAVAIDSMGRIVVAGRVGDAAVVSRFLPDGAPDPSFPSWVHGEVGAQIRANDLAFTPTDGVVIAGSVTRGAGIVAFAARIIEGVTDPTFGVVEPEFTATRDRHEALAVLLEEDGDVVLAGWAEGAPSTRVAALWRLGPTGARDTTFGDMGVVPLGVTGTDEAFLDVVASVPGGTLAVGYTIDDPIADGVFLRVNGMGIGPMTRRMGASGGVVRATAAVTLPDNSVLVAGFTGVDVMGGFTFWRLEPLGVADDITFPEIRISVSGADERIVTAGALVQRDGDYLAVGSQLDTGDIVLARVHPHGMPNTSWSATGVVAVDVGGFELGRAVAEQASGRLVVAGSSDDDAILVGVHP